MRPAPGLLLISMDPRSASTLRRTTSMPTPRPETSVTSRAVEKPGARIRREDLRLRRAASAPSIKPLLDGAGAHRLHIQAAAVVADPDQDVRRRSACAERWILAVGGLPAARRASGVSMP